MRLYKFRVQVSYFFSRRKGLLRRFYWAGIAMLVVTLFAIPITFAIVNPHVRLPFIHGGPPAQMVMEWERAVAEARREEARIEDFIFVVNQMNFSYPFLGVAEASRGFYFMDSAVEVLDKLFEVAAYDASPGFLQGFIEEHFLSLFGGYGGLRLTGEGRALADWLTQPYFFGFYDLRFDDEERFGIEVLGDNIFTEILDNGVMYLRINGFLPKGYEAVHRTPFWYFAFETERQYLLDLFESIYDFDYLIIDIRGIGSGFGDYFLPLLLEPNLHEPITGYAYAFHTAGIFAYRVSNAFREWYGFGETHAARTLSERFAYTLPANLERGFPIRITAEPTGEAFNGQIILLTDSDNFSGPNFIYLQMAADAGFLISYEENPDGIGWATSFSRLPRSGLSLRYNPLFFTDATGRPFEQFGLGIEKRSLPYLLSANA